MDAPVRNLVYTVAIDPPGSSGCRTLAKMLISSLLRTWFTGDILVFRNTEAPLFPVERKGLEEIYIRTRDVRNAAARAEDAWCWKYRVRDQIDTGRYDKVLFLDADCLALRNIDHLLEGDWDIRCQPERGLPLDSPQFSCFLTDTELAANADRWGVNSGTIAVRGAVYDDVMCEWERIDTSTPPRSRFCSDQGSWNRLLLETGHRVSDFPEEEVRFPIYLHSAYGTYRTASLVHNLGGDLVDKIQFTFALYAGTFLCDPGGVVLDLLET